jgi:uridine monophosphate synthetase
MLLLADLYENGIVRSGEFVLKSGQKSSYYVDIKAAISVPALMKRMVAELSNAIGEPHGGSDLYVCGVPHGAVPLAAMVSHAAGLPLLMLRKEAKEHGTKQMIEGRCPVGAKVVLIEDVVTTGGSMKETAAALRGAGLAVVKFVAVVSRGPASITLGHGDAGWLTPLLEVRQTSIERCRQCIGLKGRLCVAADVDTVGELVDLVQKVGPHISVLKLHIDTIKDFSQDLIYRLIELKRRYGFLIWEDRKFADIGAVAARQIHGGVYKISSWADVVSVHLLPGPGVLSEIGTCGAIVVGEMSSKGALADGKYLNACIELSKERPGVVGMVTQTDCAVPGIKVVPGVGLAGGTDDKDQRYSSLSSRSWGDLFVVGRDIVQNHDPCQRCIEYRERIDELKQCLE